MSVGSKSHLVALDTKLLVTTSNHILVNLADFAGMEEHDSDVWTTKRERERVKRQVPRVR